MGHLRVTIAALVAVALASCQFFGSSDASIVSFSLDGITVDASIDPDARTVVVSAPPVDLSKIPATIAVSTGAELEAIPTFVDGVPTTVTVIAEDGTEVTWTVTVNLQLGVSFKLDGEWVFYLHGVTDSSSDEAAEDWGNGAPHASVVTGEGSTLVFFATTELIDFVADSALPDFIQLWIDGTTVGTYADGTAYGDLRVSDDYWWTNEGTAVLERIDTVGGTVVVRFAFDLVNDSDQSATVADGFAKLLRIIDDQTLQF